MSASRIRKIVLNYKFLLLFFIAILFWSPLLFSANEQTNSENNEYSRADAETIKTTTNQILSEKEFAPRKTFLQWLTEKLDRSNFREFSLNKGWVSIIKWVIIAWCVLTLAAIFGHFIYTLALLIRPGRTSSRTSGSIDSKIAKITSFSELYKMAQELARQGNIRDAISLMSTAMLRWLDSANVVNYHDSKTNGDYIREYPADSAGRKEFKRFVLISEQTIYGGFGDNNQIFNEMYSLMEHIRSSVSGKE